MTFIIIGLLFFVSLFYFFNNTISSEFLKKSLLFLNLLHNGCQSHVGPDKALFLSFFTGKVLVFF